MKAVDGVDLAIRQGEILGLAEERMRKNNHGDDDIKAP